MGIRLGIRAGTAVLDGAKIEKLTSLVESLSELDCDDAFNASLLLEQDNFNRLKEVCGKLGLDAYLVRLQLTRESSRPYSHFAFREYSGKEEVTKIDAIRHCHFLKKSLKVNPLLIQTAADIADSRYGDTLDTYLYGNSICENKMKLLGAGAWPITGYVAKEDFTHGRMTYLKNKTYYWGDMIGYINSYLTERGSSIAKVEKAKSMSEVIGLSEHFHPAVSDAILYLIYKVYEFVGKQKEFDVDNWRFSLYPCIMLDWR